MRFVSGGLFQCALLLQLAGGCSMAPSSSSSGAPQGVQGPCDTPGATLPAPILYWQTVEEPGLRVIARDGTPGPLLDIGTNGWPVAFYPERDFIAVWLQNGLKIMDANQARPPQYLTLDGYQLAAATGNPDGTRIVTMFEAVPSDAGTPGNLAIIWDVDGAGMATERHRVDMGSLDMETAFPLALDSQRVVFATAYWAPTGEEGARRVLMLNLDTGDLRELFRPLEADDLLYWLIQREANVMFVATRPHTDTGDSSQAVTHALSMESGTALGEVRGMIAGGPINGNRFLKGDEPGLVATLQGLRVWRPWLDPMPQEPMGSATYAAQVGDVLVTTLTGVREAWVTTRRESNPVPILEHHAAMPPKGEHEIDVHLNAGPLYLAPDGTSVMFTLFYFQDDFGGTLGQDLLANDGCRWALWGDHVAATGQDPPNSDAGSALYVIMENGRPGRVAGLAPLKQGIFKGRGWFGY
jgi:hypothetical protein